MASPGELVLSSPSRAIGARLMKKQYMPTALIALELPAGSLEMSACVPRFSNDAESSEGKRLDEYVAAIRSTIKVFAKYHHRKESLAEYHRYIVWVDGWAQLSGFGRYCVVSETVRVLPRALLCWLVAMAIVEDA